MRRTVTPFTVDALTTPEQIVASGPCKRIRVREQAVIPTVNFAIRAPGATDPTVEYAMGEEVVFVADDGALFQTGELVAHIETLSGSADFSQQEEG